MTLTLPGRLLTDALDFLHNASVALSLNAEAKAQAWPDAIVSEGRARSLTDDLDLALEEAARELAPATINSTEIQTEIQTEVPTESPTEIPDPAIREGEEKGEASPSAASISSGEQLQAAHLTAGDGGNVEVAWPLDYV